MPSRGQVDHFLGALHSQAILDRVYGGTSEAEPDNQFERMVTIGKELAEDGALILKFWMQLSRYAQ